MRAVAELACLPSDVLLRPRSAQHSGFVLRRRCTSDPSTTTIFTKDAVAVPVTRPRARLATITRSPTTSNKDRKRLLRTVIADITLLPEPDRTEARIRDTLADKRIRQPAGSARDSPRNRRAQPLPRRSIR